MKRRNAWWNLGSIALLVGFALAACSAPIQPDPRPTVPETYDEVDGIPTLTLSDGTLVVLDRLELRDELAQRFPAPPETAPDLRLEPQQLPARIDLSPLQTSVKDQQGRGTCVAFATAAAIEAAYRRERGLTLDLSEQYANHIQKMTALPEAAVGPGTRETQLGAWGGSGVGYQLGWLFRLRHGLPLESSMAGIVAADPSLTYIPWNEYENTNQDGDAPRVAWNDPAVAQSVVDAWNLNPEPTAYSTPTMRTLTNFPRGVLEGATYGVARVRAVPLNLDAIRGELAAGREVAFGVGLTRVRPCTDEDGAPLPEGDACYDLQREDIDTQYEGGVWRPLETPLGGHAMVIVGYDDADRVFIVKNSWGRDADGRGRPAQADPDADGFIEMSYDWMPRINEAYSVLETRDPASWSNVQSWLGKWHVEADTALERADLAAYHLPGAFPSSALSGQTDNRLGTLYDESRVFRVNAALRGERLDAYFGPEADTDYQTFVAETTVSAKRVGDTALAGWVHPTGDVDAAEPFFASLEGYPEMQAAREDPVAAPAPIDFFGVWRVEGGGLDGEIEFESSVADGTYTPATGSPVSGVELEINPNTFIGDPDDPCFVRLTVPLATPVVLDGYLFCATGTDARRALIAGVPGGDGFYAYRLKLAPSLTIVAPSDGSSVPRGRQRAEFRARTTGFTSPPTIRWESSIDGLLAERSDGFGRVDLSFGTHTITATTADPAGDTLRDSVSLTITNDPPTVDILEPTGAGPFCDGETVAFRAEAQDLNNTPSFELPDGAVSWSVAGEAPFASGKSVTRSFAVGGYTIVATATDDQGAAAEDSINLTVESCADTPPDATITTPAEDTGNSDPDFVYDGFDEGRGQWYTDVTLTGTGTDAEDGALTGGSLVWTTDRTDLQIGELGTGGNLTVQLYSDDCFGAEHLITLTVTDSDGNSRTAVRSIRIWQLC